MTVLGLTVAACGKKGPPLAPIVHVPAAVDKASARRIGNDIYVTLGIPVQNIDSSMPADVSRVDLYGATSLTPPPVARFFEIASRVASIDVQPPPPADTGAPAPPPQRTDLPAQGTTVTLRDALSAEALQPKTLAATPSRTTTPTPPSAIGLAPAPAPAFPRRYYVAVAVSERGRQGPPGILLEVPLPPLPDPPEALTFSSTEDEITIAWEPSGGIVGFLFDKPVAPETAPVDEPPGAERPGTPADALPEGPTRYNVYRAPASDQAATSQANANVAVAPAEPINPAPLTQLSFSDSSPFQFGQERCYTVRAVRGAGSSLVVSAPSALGCITPVDTYAPQAPTGLYALAADGVISLSWEPNGEADLGGYVVLRGRAGDATLQPLADGPVKETRYTDRDVMAGVRYVYAVRAVDMQPRPNISGESNRVEETAR